MSPVSVPFSGIFDQYLRKCFNIHAKRVCDFLGSARLSRSTMPTARMPTPWNEIWSSGLVSKESHLVVFIKIVDITSSFTKWKGLRSELEKVAYDLRPRHCPWALKCLIWLGLDLFSTNEKVLKHFYAISIKLQRQAIRGSSIPLFSRYQSRWLWDIAI